MRLRRTFVLASAIAVGAISGLALSGVGAPTSSSLQVPSAAGGLSAGHDATIAPQVARISQTWADRPSDDRHATALFVAFTAAALPLALLGAGIVAASSSLGLRQPTLALAPARGPPSLQLP